MMRWVSSATTAVGTEMVSCDSVTLSMGGNFVGALRSRLTVSTFGPPPVRLCRPVRMLSTLSELRASAAAKVSMLPMALFSDAAFSSKIWFRRFSASRADAVISLIEAESATSIGGWPLTPSGRAAPIEPPVRVIVAVPVSPRKSMPTRVSALTGVRASTAMRAITLPGSSATSDRPVTSPTWMPLNSTGDPADRPATDPLMLTA
jgi:hypothetical protein